MKKAAILFFIFSVAISLSSAQMKRVLKDNMRHQPEKYAWSLDDNMALKNGLFIKSNDKQIPTIGTRVFALDYTSDFEIEVLMKFKGKGMGGLIFARNDHNTKPVLGSSGYAFGITSKGKYSLFHEKNGAFLPHFKGKSTAIPKGSKSAKLTMIRKKEIWHFVVNKDTIYSTRSRDAFGIRMGFFALGKKNEIEFDRLMVKSPTDVDEILMAKTDARERGIELQQDAFTEVNFTNIGFQISKAGKIVDPMHVPDEKQMVFLLEKKGKTPQWYTIHRVGLGSWSEPELLGETFKDPTNFNIQNPGADGNTLLLGPDYSIPGPPRGFRLVHKSTSAWMKPKVLDIPGFDTLDLQHNAHGFLGPDQKTLLFSVAPDTVSGGRQMYVTKMDKNGDWSTPVWAGFILNEKGKTTLPVHLSADGRTLYFASDKFPGYGGLDLFVTRRVGKSWSTWKEPKNLGPHFNTTRNDTLFTLAPDGVWAYESAPAPGIRGEGIYKLKLPKSLQSDPVMRVYGKVKLKGSDHGMQVQITAMDTQTGEEIAIATSHMFEGHYSLLLPAKGEYILHVRKNGFEAQDQLISTGDLTEFTERNIDWEVTNTGSN